MGLTTLGVGNNGIKKDKTDGKQRSLQINHEMQLIKKQLRNTLDFEMGNGIDYDI